MSKTKEEEIVDPWVVASQYAKLFGEIPASFNTLVRTCISSYENKNDIIEDAVAFELKRFLKSDSMKAPFYFYIKTIKPELLEKTADFSKNCREMFSASEIASVLPILYLYRRAQRLISEDDWRFIGPNLIKKSELALHIGLAINNIGAGFAFIAGAIRYISMMTFLVHDKKGFGEYRRHLKLKNLPFDMEYEISRWGCTHEQVAVNIIVSMGFPSKIAQSMQKGLEAQELNKELKKDKIAYGIKLIEVWSDSLVETGNLPDIQHDGDFYPLKESMERMNQRVALTLTQNTQFAWIDKVKDNVNQDETPELV